MTPIPGLSGALPSALQTMERGAERMERAAVAIADHGPATTVALSDAAQGLMANGGMTLEQGAIELSAGQLQMEVGISVMGAMNESMETLIDLVSRHAPLE